MGRQDLGTCIIMSREDVGKLGIRLQKLQKIDNFITPSLKTPSFFNVEKRLIKYVERKARKVEADIVIITSQIHSFTSLQEYVAYKYSLYRYK